MKIVFFSDIHGNLGAFRAFQNQLDAEKPDLTVFCGDVFGYYYHQNKILTALREGSFRCLLGNHDHYFLELLDGKRDCSSLCEKYGSSYQENLRSGIISADNISFLRSLKPKMELECGECKIGIFHGSPIDPLEGRIYPDTKIINEKIYTQYDIVVLGHTHHKMVRKIGKTLLFNPGSLGQQRDGRGCSSLTLDTDTGEVIFRTVEYPIETLLEEIHERDPDKKYLASVLTRKPVGS